MLEDLPTKQDAFLLQESPEIVIKKVLKGLNETITLAQHNLEKISVEKRPEVEHQLNRLQEVYKQLGGGSPKQRSESPAKPLVNELQNDVEQLMKTVKHFKDIFENLEKEEVVDKKLVQAIKEEIQNIQRAAVSPWKQAKKAVENSLKTISSLVSTDTTMERREGRALRLLVQDENKIQEMIVKAEKVVNSLGELAKGTADSSSESAAWTALTGIVNEFKTLAEQENGEKGDLARMIQYMRERQTRVQHLKQIIGATQKQVGIFNQKTNITEEIARIAGEQGELRQKIGELEQIEQALIRLYQEYTIRIPKIIQALTEIEQLMSSLLPESSKKRSSLMSQLMSQSRLMRG